MLFYGPKVRSLWYKEGRSRHQTFQNPKRILSMGMFRWWILCLAMKPPVSILSLVVKPPVSMKMFRWWILCLSVNLPLSMKTRRESTARWWILCLTMKAPLSMKMFVLVDIVPHHETTTVYEDVFFDGYCVSPCIHQCVIEDQREDDYGQGFQLKCVHYWHVMCV